jgi:tetratricopeptide (TPR) repeat protein
MAKVPSNAGRPAEKPPAFDRENTLKNAEKLLRQGRLDAAIAEYVRVVEAQPRDLNTANILGDLYVRANQSDKAVAQYGRIANHFLQDGFYPKAAALYKKILKISPDDEPTQLQLADISTRQGLLSDAKAYLTLVASKRRARGDHRGADEIVAQLGTLDPSDIDARLAGARALVQSGDEAGAAARFRDMYDDLREKGREAPALEALREAVRYNPGDRQGRAILAKAAVAAGDVPAARGYLDRETAGSDPTLLVALLDLELRAGNLENARELLPQIFALDRELRHNVLELAWTLADSMPEASYVCVDAVVEAAISVSEFDEAASILREFVTRLPTHVPALLRLVEICVDGGFETPMYEAQAQLADAYLSTGQAVEARVIAEDLVAREPWEGAHIERFRRALVMLRVPEPDTVIAERLSGQTPFTATDRFYDSSLPAGGTTYPAESAPSPERTPPQLHVIRPPHPPVIPAPQPPAIPPPQSQASPPVAHPAGATAPTAPPSKPAPSKPEASKESTTAPVTVPVAAAVPPPQSRPHPRGPVEIDLTSILGDLQAPVPAHTAAPREELDDVFKGLRQVASVNVPDDAPQQMTLARTYLELGMLEEATTAFKAAARSPRHRFEAAAILGRLYKQHGDVRHAIEWFERAAEAPASVVEDGRALLYDLGVTLEEAGEVSRALAVFLELHAEAGEYRDVSERTDRLARVQTGG